MDLFAISASEIGFWGDKLLYVILAGGCLIARSRAALRRRREDAHRCEERDADLAASIHKAGPPLFNG